jgi:hypothetical protein
MCGSWRRLGRRTERLAFARRGRGRLGHDLLGFDGDRARLLSVLARGLARGGRRGGEVGEHFERIDVVALDRRFLVHEHGRRDERLAERIVLGQTRRRDLVRRLGPPLLVARLLLVADTRKLRWEDRTRRMRLHEDGRRRGQRRRTRRRGRRHLGRAVRRRWWLGLVRCARGPDRWRGGEIGGGPRLAARAGGRWLGASVGGR